MARLPFSGVSPARSCLVWLPLVSALLGQPTGLLAQETGVPLHARVEVSTLPAPSVAAPPSPRGHKSKPFLTPDPEGFQMWRDFLRQNPWALPPAPGFIHDAASAAAVTTPLASTASTVSQQFEGLANVDNVALTGFSVLPPDSGLGVGPSHIFQMVNIVGRITDKSGVAFQSFSLNSFFQVDAGFDESDPRVIYDAISGRWFGSYVEFSSSASSVLLAVSATSDPTGSFCVYRIGNPTAETFLQISAKEGKLDRIDREISLAGALSEEQRARLLQIAERCPVHRTLTSEINIRTRPA